MLSSSSTLFTQQIYILFANSLRKIIFFFPLKKYVLTETSRKQSCFRCFHLENQNAFSDGAQKVICFSNTSVFCFFTEIKKVLNT